MATAKTRTHLPTIPHHPEDDEFDDIMLEKLRDDPDVQKVERQLSEKLGEDFRGTDLWMLMKTIDKLITNKKAFALFTIATAGPKTNKLLNTLHALVDRITA